VTDQLELTTESVAGNTVYFGPTEGAGGGQSPPGGDDAVQPWEARCASWRRS
jgi:hypothetical protein